MPLYGGSIGQGYSDALSAIARQNIEKAQAAEMAFNLMRAQQMNQANRGIGPVLYQMYGQGMPLAGTTAPPLPPGPGQQSVPLGPPSPATAGPGGPQVGAMPPAPSMGGAPLPGFTPDPTGQADYVGQAGTISGQMTGGDPSTASNLAWQSPPQMPQVQAPGSGVLAPGAPPPPGLTAPRVPPYQSMPEPSPAGAGTATPAGPPSPPGAPPGATTVTAQAPPSPYAGIPSIMQAPDIRRFVQTAKKMGVDPALIADMLTQANPIFGTEYRAAIAAQNAYIRSIQADTQRERAGTYAEDVAGKNIERQEKSIRADIEESRKQRATDALIKKWDAERKRIEKMPAGSEAQKNATAKFNAKIEADRNYILANPPGSMAQANDINYMGRVVNAMTEKLGDDPDYDQWQDFKVEKVAQPGWWDAFKQGIGQIYQESQRAVDKVAPPAGQRQGPTQGGGWSIAPAR